MKEQMELSLSGFWRNNCAWGGSYIHILGTFYLVSINNIFSFKMCTKLLQNEKSDTMNMLIDNAGKKLN